MPTRPSELAFKISSAASVNAFFDKGQSAPRISTTMNSLPAERSFKLVTFPPSSVTISCKWLVCAKEGRVNKLKQSINNAAPISPIFNVWCMLSLPHASYQNTSLMKVKTPKYDTTDTSEYQQVISCLKLEICLSQCVCKSACCFVLAARPGVVANKNLFFIFGKNTKEELKTKVKR